MIIRRLRIQNVRCFRNPIELSGLGLGVHVIHAPNETGKSSLILAIARALFDRYSSKDRAIIQLQPWSTELSPRVTLELETGGKRYRLEKSFLGNASSQLSEWTGTRFEHLADSQDADDRVRGFLTATGPGSGATKVGHWGVARLLWLNQVPERHELPGLDGSLKARLLETMGVAALSTEEQALIKAVETTYGQFFTPKTQKPVAGSELIQHEEKIRNLKATVTRLMQRKEETSRNADDITENRLQQTRLLEEKDGYAKQLTELQERIQEEERQEQALSLCRKDVERHRQRWQDLDQKQRALQEMQGKAVKQEALVAQKQPAVQQAQDALKAAEAASQAAREHLRGAQAAADKAEQRLERGRLLEKALEVREGHSQAEGHLKQGLRLEAALQGSLKKTAGSTLSEASVKRAEELEKKLLLAQSKLDAQAIEVCFTAESPRVIEWEEHGTAREHKLAKAEQKRFSGVTSGELRIKGVGTLNVRTGADELGKLQSDVDKCRKEFARRLHEHGAKDLAGLRKAWEEQRAAAQVHLHHQEALQSFLDTVGVTDIDALRERQRTLAGELGSLATQLGIAVEALAPQQAADIEALSEALKQARREVKLREKMRDETDSRFRLMDQQHRTLTLEQERAGQSARTLRQTLQSQLEGMGWSLDEFDTQVERAEAEVQRHEAKVRKLEAALPVPEQRATTQRGKLQQALGRIQDEEQATQTRITRAETMIEQAVNEDLYTQLCVAEEELEQEQQRYNRAHQRAEAAKALRALTTAWQEQVSHSFVSPIEEAVHHRLKFIRGEDAPGRIQLDADFGEAQMRTDTGSKPLESFSWGTQEQTLFALRLAIGDLLSTQGPRTEPQLVVLDDALVNTDAGRHRRALELIESAGEKLQVLILTAFPERYRTLQNMKSFDLKALAQAS
ncbi:AAA family ATPase [Corallococcus exiguus]|uniref:AAA family ATPase n=1 Tax=Corallococcus exiguus TaxID=83462 RepID=UPI003DA22880